MTWCACIQESHKGMTFGTWMSVPKLSLHEMEAIEFALSHGTLHDAHQIDKKRCLLAMYEEISTCLRSCPLLSDSQDVIMISPMRRAGAARLTFDQCEHHFEWMRWNTWHKDDRSIKICRVFYRNWEYPLDPVRRRRNHQTRFWLLKDLLYPIIFHSYIVCVTSIQSSSAVHALMRLRCMLRHG